MDYFAQIDGNVIRYIAEFLGEHFCLAMRAIARRFREAIPPPKHMTVQQLMKRAAFEGNARDCALALEYGAGYHTMIKHAARGGHLALCRLAHLFVKTVTSMAAGAALGANVAAFELAMEWHDVGGYIDFDYTLMCAGRGGSIKFFEYLPKHTQIDYNEAMLDAAQYGHLELCKYLIDHGANHFDGMLTYGARGGQRHICEFAFTLGAKDHDRMLQGAAQGGQVEFCKWAISLGAKHYLLAIERSKNYETFRFLLDYVAVADLKNINWYAPARGDLRFCQELIKMNLMKPDDLYWAASRGHRHICEYARSIGATDFNYMLESAIEGEQMKMGLLAISWGATACKEKGVKST